MNFIQVNQELTVNQEICFINPTNSDYYVEADVPQQNFGKIKVGQNVSLKFFAYPYEEFGSIQGRIDYINLIPNDSGYLTKIKLLNGLKTTHNQFLVFRSGLLVNADIKTDNLRLLQRIYYSTIRLLKR
ncbi:MAG: HlyD family efflux transporter periplasmic adaptor subunit [Agriterribacter sp.]